MQKEAPTQETETRTVSIVDGVATESPLSVFDAGAGALFAKAIVTPVKAHDKKHNAPSEADHRYEVTNLRTGASMIVEGHTNISPSFTQVQWSGYSPKKVAEAALGSVGDMLDGKMKEAIVQRMIAILDGEHILSEERIAAVKHDIGRMGREAEITKPCRQDASKVKTTRMA